MTDNKKNNRRKRAAITAILLLLALLIGWDRFSNPSPISLTNKSL